MRRAHQSVPKTPFQPPLPAASNRLPTACFQPPIPPLQLEAGASDPALEATGTKTPPEKPFPRWPLLTIKKVLETRVRTKTNAAKKSATPRGVGKGPKTGQRILERVGPLGPRWCVCRRGGTLHRPGRNNEPAP